MKKLLLGLVLILSISTLSAQTKHIKWTVAGKKTGKTTAEVYFKATLDPHWHIWSQTPGDEMLIPPSFNFDDKTITKVSKAKEVGKKVSKKEEGFDGVLNSYEGTVIFIQKINGKNLANLKGFIEYQICDEKSCLPPTEFKFDVKLK